MRAPEPITTLPSRWLCSNWKGVKSSVTDTCDHASAEEPSDSTAAISAGVKFLNWGITIVLSRCKYNELSAKNIDPAVFRMPGDARPSPEPPDEKSGCLGKQPDFF